jgi:hypothetical protein
MEILGLLSELTTGLMTCATRAERNARNPIWVILTLLRSNGSRSIRITHYRISLGINGSDENICAKSLKILSVQECRDELISGITGRLSVIDRGHGAYFSSLGCRSLSTWLSPRISRLFFENLHKRSAAMLFSLSCAHSES